MINLTKRIKLYSMTGASNHHGTQKKGQPWNREPVRARFFVKFRYVKLQCKPPSTGHRIIMYYRSGACRYFDIYVDRRDA